jgi:3-dehydroquinate synthetase/shikimate kinase
MTARGIYLIGFSGTGKSAIADLVGAELNWPVYDLDRIIAECSGMSIPMIFEREGEAGFRVRETEALRDVAHRGPFVVATGGGAALRAENRHLMAGAGWIIALEGRPETLHTRIQRQLQQSESAAIRPLLGAVSPLEQIRALKHSRQSVYALADWTVHTDRLSPAQVAAEVVRAVQLLAGTGEPSAAFGVPAAPRHSLSPDPPAVLVAAGPWPYQVAIGWQHLHALGPQIRRLLPRTRQVAALIDPATWARTGAALRDTLLGAGLEVHIREVADDERVKTLDEARALYDWLLDLRLRRDDLVLVCGGAAINDLGGYVASTFLRGVPLVSVPASLEGMVDSAIGGKTALNHRRARNMIGTFYHPRLVWADVSLVASEPPRQLRAAWAEVVKYAMLESALLPGEAIGEPLFAELERGAAALIGLERSALLQIIARCAALKAQVVAADERDLGQYRMLLNYGHTVGQALEAATEYQLPHGEAVAIGMAVEARLAVRLGMASAAVEQRQNGLLARFGLPTQLPPVARDRLLELIDRDKKVFGDAPRWVLPTAIGRAVVSSTVRDTDLTAALDELGTESTVGE